MTTLGAGMGGISAIPMSAKVLFLSGTGFVLGLMCTIIMGFVADNIKKSKTYDSAPAGDTIRAAYSIAWQTALAAGLFTGVCLALSVGLVVFMLKTGK